MQVLLQELFATALLSRTSTSCLLAKCIVQALRSQQERVILRALRALAETWRGWLRVFPYLPERIGFNPEEPLLVRGQLALLLEEANCVQEVTVVDCVHLTAVDAQQVSPDIAPEAALVVGEHARRFRNQLQVDRGLFLENFMLLLRGRVVCAILQWM